MPDNHPLISLCAITGNCEEYIERFLDSFSTVADEIILVRAIGSQNPDHTLELASRWRKVKTAEYFNRNDHLDWPHVDNFAAARQKSFDLADGRYCFWADIDDVLLSGEDVVRELAEQGAYPVFLFPYDIFGRGVTVPRERMILRGTGRWRYPVHECIVFPEENMPAWHDERVVVQHLPRLDKSGSNQRNLRILEAIPENDMTPGLLYHLAGELAATPGRKADSVEASKKALASRELGKPERYETYLNLARNTDKPELKQVLLHQAYQVDPTRREALGLLTCNCMDYGLAPEALAYARAMMSLPEPETKNWNDRPAAYGWLGWDIYQQALRINGLMQKAEQIRIDELQQNKGPILSLIHATRGRPKQAALARKIWLDLAENPGAIEHMFVIDEDDETSLPLCRMHHYVAPAGKGCVGAWNLGAALARSEILVAMSDDWMPPAKWDQIILDRLGDTSKPAVLAVSDGHRVDDLLCMAICTRAYVMQDWWMFHPGFMGVYSDNWFTELAKKRGQIVDARDIVFRHDHPIFTGAAADETYQRQNSPERYSEGKTVYDRLMAGKDWSSCEGFFNYWEFYAQVARKLSDGDMVAEVGVYCGRSLIFLAQECERLGKDVQFFAVDNWASVEGGTDDLRRKFTDNIERCGVSDRIWIIESDSDVAAERITDGALAFCWIDAAHDYESVKKDLLAWKPKMQQGGIFAGHDAQWHEVERAVKEILGEENVEMNGVLWVAK